VTAPPLHARTFRDGRTCVIFIMRRGRPDVTSHVQDAIRRLKSPDLDLRASPTRRLPGMLLGLSAKEVA
jgi:hypothetical protein